MDDMSQALLAMDARHQEEIRNVHIQALKAMTRIKGETSDVRCELFHVHVDYTRSLQVAASENSGVRDEMQTLRSVKAEKLKAVRRKYGARVGKKTKKINALKRQRAEDLERHREAMGRLQEQLVAQNARHREETAELRLEAAADVVNVQIVAAQEVAVIRAQASQQHNAALRNQEEEITRLREENAQLRRQVENQNNNPDSRLAYIPVANKNPPMVMVNRDQLNRLEERLRELEAGQRLYRVGQGILVNIADIHGEARQMLDEALRNGEHARTVLDLQGGN